MHTRIENDFIIQQLTPYTQPPHNFQIFLAGGFLRDLLLDKPQESLLDRDIIIKGIDAGEFAQILSPKLKCRLVVLDEFNKIYRLIMPDKINYIDITNPIEDNIEKDIKRRDLTINALAYDIEKKQLIDLVGGIEDIKNGILREISEQNFIDDPLRLLRVFRFQSCLGFEIASSLEDIVIKNARQIQIKNTACERINVELTKLFAGKNADNAIKNMDKTGLLELIMPEIMPVKTVPPNSHHHLNLFEHSIETMRQINTFIENSDSKIKEHFDEKRLSLLKLSGFYHDIGKPQTWTIEPDTNKHRFMMHDEVGSKLVAPMLRRLKYSNKQIKYVQKMIKHHIYPSSLVASESFSSKAQMKFYRKMEDDVIDIIILARADRLSALGVEVTQERVENNLNGLAMLLENYFELKDELKPLEKLLDGNEIIQLTGLKASKQLGNIIKKLKEAQLSGDVNTKDEAIDFIKKIEY